MSTAILNKDTVKSPQRSRLGLCLDRERLHVLIKDSIAEIPVYCSFQLDMSLGSVTKALEEIVYNNPILLSDFAKVDVTLRSPDFMLIPDALGAYGVEFIESMADTAMADTATESMATLESPVARTGCSLIVRESRDVVDFIRRTFNNPTIAHSLAVLASHYVKSSPLGTSDKMYINMYDDKLDIAIFGERGLSLLNTFAYADPMDAVYYIMATRSELGLDQTSGEIFIYGDAPLRDAVTPTLREYLGYVMPLVPPTPIIRGGAPAKEAPFDLTLLLLCE